MGRPPCPPSNQSAVLKMCSELHLEGRVFAARVPVSCYAALIWRCSRHWRAGCTLPSCQRARDKTERNLTTLFTDDESAQMPAIEAVAVPRKHNGWLPFLTVLFLISYGLLTMLVVEQGRTIDSQRALIRDLFRDSQELSAVKHRAGDSQMTSPAIPYSQAPSGRIPSTQAPYRQAPSSQIDPQVRPENEAGTQKPFRMPSRPASDLGERARAVITI